MSNKNEDQSAYPFIEYKSSGDVVSMGQGLTKREYFAAMAMQGMLTNATYIETSIPVLAESAIQYADELLNQLSP